MSNEYYSKWLIKTKDNLAKVMGCDLELLEMKSIRDRSLANNLLGGLYARYAMVVQELDACMDQMIQAQKGFTVRKITDAAVIRLNELKEELTKLDISEYHYIDGALIELKLIPHDIEIINPTLVYPRPYEYHQFWEKLKNDEVIYEPPLEGEEEQGEGEEGAPKKKVKKKKVKVDPLAMLAAGLAPEPEPVVEEQEEEAVEEEEGGFDLRTPVQSRVSVRRSTRRSRISIRRERKKRPCLRPKVASQLEAEMTAEEKEALQRNIRYHVAVIMIQSHERARQSRLYVHDVTKAQSANIAKMAEARMSRRHSQPPIDKDQEDEDEEVPVMDSRVLAAIRIQTWWRGYLARSWSRYRELRLRLLIGMVMPSYRSKEELQMSRKGLKRRREARMEALREFYQTLIDEKARVLKVVAPGLFEDIGDEIRQWFKDWYYGTKTFKDIPPAAQGGTILVVRGDVETPQEHFQEMLKRNKKGGPGGAAGKAAQEAKAKKEAAEKKKEEEKKKKAAAEKKAKAKGAKRRSQDYEFAPQRTAAMDAMDQGFEEYDHLWANVNDAENPRNKPYMETITEQKCYEVQMEVRPKVDELMRIELEILKGAVQKDKWIEKKGKGKGKKGAFKPKKTKGKKGKAAGGAGGGGKRGRRKKDPTGNRKVEDIFQELYQNGIIRKYPEVHIDEFISDFSYQNYEQREKLRDPPATLADARQAVTMTCIVPLGVTKMARAKSVMLTGPRECGLDILANAVFTETQCVLFDLSPSNIYGKYPGKKGNKDLVHLVTKMSKLLQPSVIYIEDCEKAYYKKVPKEEKENDPKRVGKFLAKIIKPITQEDRVLVLGTSYYPFLAQGAKLKKVFQKILLVPRSDYGSLYIFWQDVLLGYHGVDRNFNLSALATMTRNYPLPQIRLAIESVLVPGRIIALHNYPLQAVELIDALREGTGAVSDPEWDKYLKFYAGTKLGKARKALNAEFAKLVDSEKKKKEGKAPPAS